MATGVNVYPYDAEPDVAPTYPPLPEVTDADVGKSLVLGEDLTLSYESVITPDSARLLPAPSVEDAGKSPVIDEAGEYVLAASALPEVDVDDAGKQLVVDEAGAIVLQASALPEVDVADAGKQLVIDGAGAIVLAAPAIAVSTEAGLATLEEDEAYVSDLAIGVTRDANGNLLGPEYIILSSVNTGTVADNATIGKAPMNGVYKTVFGYVVIKVKPPANNDVSNFWTVKVKSGDSMLAAQDTTADTPDAWTTHVLNAAALGDPVMLADGDPLTITVEKSGTPDPLDIAVAAHVRNIVEEAPE